MVASSSRPCDRCGSARAEAVFRNCDALSGETFDILRCDGCGLLRTGFGGNAEDLGRYYGPCYYGARGRRFRTAFESAVARFRESRARLIAQAAEGPGRILDLGCGRGLLLGELRTMGWDCVGTEISEELAETVREELGVTVLTGLAEHLPYEHGSFDAVTAWHSLEHMEKPVRMLEDVARLLKPGGLLVVEVPNASSLQARLGGGAWFHLDAPRHLVHFSRENLGAILGDLGFTVSCESTLSLEQGPFGMVQSLLNRITFAPNVLYRIIRRSNARGRSPGGAGPARLRAAWDLAATILLALPIGLAGTALELLACAVDRGGIVRFVAFKGPEGNGTPGKGSRPSRS